MAASSKSRSPAQKAASKKLAARNKAAYRALDAQKKKGNPNNPKKKNNPKKSNPRSKKKGTALVPMIVGTGVGAGMAIGTTALVRTAASAVGVKMPVIVDQAGPLVGLAVVYGASFVAPALKPLVMPAAIGTGLVMALNWWMRSRAKKTNGAGRSTARAGSGQYARLNGSGSNVARAVGGSGMHDMAGSGSNVARAVA